MSSDSREAQVHEDTNVLAAYLGVGRPVLALIGGHDADARRIPSIIRGWCANQYILIDRPEDCVARKQDHIIVQFLHDGIVCGFSSEFLDSGATRPPLFRIAWPSALETLSLRQHDRASVDVECMVALPCGTTLQGRMEDISAGGCRVVLPEKMVEHTEVLLDFALDGVHAFRGIQAAVCSSKGKEDAFPTGLRFCGLSPSDQHTIDLFAATQTSGLRTAQAAEPEAVLLQGSEETGRALSELAHKDGIKLTCVAKVADLFRLIGARPFAAAVLAASHPQLPGSQVAHLLHDSDGGARIPIALLGGGERPGKDADAGAYAVVLTVEDAAGWLRSQLTGDEAPAG